MDIAKVDATHVEDAETLSNAGKQPRVQLPPLLADLPAEEREKLNVHVKRKIDLRLLPMMLLMYIMNYLDRNNIAAAKIAGMSDDLNLKGNQYQTALSILFVGYLLMQVPSNLMLNKFGKPALYLPTCMVIWGVISTCTGAVQSFGGLVACRFVLGFVEAAYFPGCLYYLSAWYTRKELVLRTAILYSGSLISGAFSGLIAAGITDNMAGARGLGAWRWLFIIEGAITIVLALIAFFILPNFPRTTSWLSEPEKQMAVWRLQEDIGEDDWVNAEEQTFFHGAKLAVKDPKAWLLLATIYGFTSSGTVTTLFPSVVEGLGYGKVQTLLLTVPPYVIGVIAILINAWHADRTSERYLHIALPPLLAVAAFIIAAATTEFGPRYFAMCLMIGANYSGYVVALAWISNTLPRPPAKRAAALAGINALSNVCQIYSPYMYQDAYAPRYVVPMIVNAITSLWAAVFATVLRMLLVRLNKKIDAGILLLEQTSEEDRKRVIEEHGLPGEAVDKGFRFLV
ncbi:Major facilitator superfamily [Lasiodiplodia theobromae]|uniref:Major facilitator superfamily n=1 Tax=Lasiodiplodia theobromae TaxID=45133 RepID=A0A5N5DTH7_9PEZI|nr:MFS transporter [Lasiodiplodia theobromae]KAB2581349.1 putative transporter [Lasiodiplodia theobromae]KAF4536055.1 MFS transporter [Lasiodiplodia theobromae]KAF9629571.1 Major facilitator superfamily [Lasiodiplodia theobromae]